MQRQKPALPPKAGLFAMPEARGIRQQAGYVAHASGNHHVKSASSHPVMDMKADRRHRGQYAAAVVLPELATGAGRAGGNFSCGG